MDTDLALILGLIIAAFTVPSVMSAISERRPPRASVLTILIAIGLVTYAVMLKPGGYSVEEIPDVFFRVVGRFL
ncbi:hypothetical protein KUV26_15045 [Leisingera daeponensis]|uniref:50S ribosomal protein L35 n=1 Tax=Leisingera daeponensis TaxID=405746 RepID=A0ABS7NHT2_9RHOB|nr:hypothetical protein [Leisingera daeponensis]MBY6058400.1 hypothetical protein [Leisingera daeponensis]MBY6140755.1 hypothetical protein [Leisingera daeponensis]